MTDLMVKNQTVVSKTLTWYEPFGIKMVQIPGGSFLMGSDSHPAQLPIHQVNVASFSMSEFVITQQQWRSVALLPKIELELNPEPLAAEDHKLIGDDLPVICINWYEVQEFCARLSVATGLLYRLPSEAEWEYACRAGTSTVYSFGDRITEDNANYLGCSYEGITPKGKYSPNAYGLYDMHGNVWEMCQDTLHMSYSGAPTDGSAWMDENHEQCVLRGGSWQHNTDACRSSYRCALPSNARIRHTGFRVVCDF
jgi:formylglycine-generating enzyme required for sulfatase activity